MKENVKSTVTEVTNALGGPVKLGNLLGIGSNAVSNWRKENRFPPNQYMNIYNLVRRNGIEIAPELIGLEVLEEKPEGDQ